MRKGPSASDLADKFMLRLPEGMRTRIADEAKKNNRSMNAEIVAILQQYYDGHLVRATSPDRSFSAEEVTALLDRAVEIAIDKVVEQLGKNKVE